MRDGRIAIPSSQAKSQKNPELEQISRSLFLIEASRNCFRWFTTFGEQNCFFAIWDGLMGFEANVFGNEGPITRYFWGKFPIDGEGHAQGVFVDGSGVHKVANLLIDLITSVEHDGAQVLLPAKFYPLYRCALGCQEGMPLIDKIVANAMIFLTFADHRISGRHAFCGEGFARKSYCWIGCGDLFLDFFRKDADKRGVEETGIGKRATSIPLELCSLSFFGYAAVEAISRGPSRTVELDEHFNYGLFNCVIAFLGAKIVTTPGVSLWDPETGFRSRVSRWELALISTTIFWRVCH
jgi:hypothetical protein